MGRFLLATLLTAILICVAVILVTLAKSRRDGEAAGKGGNGDADKTADKDGKIKAQRK